MEIENNQFCGVDQSFDDSQMQENIAGYNQGSIYYSNHNICSSFIYSQELSSLTIYDKYDELCCNIFQLDLEQNQEEEKNDQVYKQENEEEQIKRAIIMRNIKLAPFDKMKIINGLVITKDGALRIFSMQGSTSFNYQQQNIDCIEDKKSLGVMDLHLSKNQSLRECSLEEALFFLKKIEGIDFYQVKFQLTRFYEHISSYLKRISIFNFSSLQLNKKDEEFQNYLEFCYSYLDRVYVQNKDSFSQMYCYQIIKYSHRDQQYEFVRSGFSKSYLYLLGLNQSNLSTIYLRKHQVDLIQEKNKITLQTIEVMDNKFRSPKEEKYLLQVQTFDGFPLNLIQRRYIINNEKLQNKHEMIIEYLFYLIEFDIEIQELQRLIEYRQKILQNSQNLSIDEYIQKELSLNFEDVEYSIHSQSFAEKFYSENIKEMAKLKEQLLIVKQKDERKPCGYKLINQNQLKNQIF